MRYAVKKAIVSPQTWVPTEIWVPETITVNVQAGITQVTWLGYFTEEAYLGGAQASNSGVYPRPTTTVTGAPKGNIDITKWACDNAILQKQPETTQNGMYAPPMPGMDNILFGGKVVTFEDAPVATP